MQKTAIIIPCYNEAKRLDTEGILQFCNNNYYIDFFLVNDGSTDNTLEIITNLSLKKEDRIKVMNLDKNVGKSEAIRQGMMYVSSFKEYDFIGFWDADFSTPLYEIKNMLDVVEKNKEINLIMGCRLKRLGADIKRSNLRHFVGRVFITFANLILETHVYDSQCGAKIFRSKVVPILFEKNFFTKWIFDIEILIRIEKYFGKNITTKSVYEYPLTKWEDVAGSKLKFFDFMRAPFELIKIHFYYNIKKIEIKNKINLL